MGLDLLILFAHLLGSFLAKLYVLLPGEKIEARFQRLTRLTRNGSGGQQGSAGEQSPDWQA